MPENPKIYPNKEKLRRVAKVMRTISHPMRLLIVELLLERKRLPVKEIYETLGISQSNASQHLKLMEQADILLSQREGAMVYYQVVNQGMAQLLSAACQCTQRN